MAGQPTISRFFKPVGKSTEIRTLGSAGKTDQSNDGSFEAIQVDRSPKLETPEPATLVQSESDTEIEAVPIGKRFKVVEEWSGESSDRKRKPDSTDAKGSPGIRSKRANKGSTSDKLTPLDQQVKDLKEANMDKLLVVRVGYKYKCFAQDAIIASQILQIKLIAGKLSFDGSNHQDPEHKQFAYCSFPENRLHVHLERLVRQDLKVGVVEQSETSAIKKYSKDTNKTCVFMREVTNTFTKATYGINNTFSSDSKRILGDTCSIWGLLISQKPNRNNCFRIISVALNSGEIVYDEFQDSEFSTEKLEIRARYLEPKEVVIAAKLPSHLERFFNQRDCIVHQQEKPTESEPRIHGVVTKANLSPNFTETIELMFEYLKDYGNEQILLISSAYQPFASKAYMLLNSNTLESLDIFSNDGGKGSLFWLLDHTRTSFGSRILKEWVLRPLLSLSEIEERLDAIECIKEEINNVFFEALNQMLKNTSDLLRTLNRIAYGNTSRKEVYFFLKQIDQLERHFDIHSNFLRHQVGDHSGHISQKSRLMTRLLRDMMTFSQNSKVSLLFSMINVSAVMEKDSEKQITEFFNLNNYDRPDLIIQRLREIDSVQDELTEELNCIRKTLKRPHLTYKNNVEYLIEVRNTQVKDLPADWVKVNNTKMISRFHTPTIIKLLEKLQYHKDLLLRDSNTEYEHFLGRIVEEYEHLRNFINNIGVYDSLLALAATSCNSNYVRPKFSSNNQYIKATNARNPVIESLDVQYVPNDINMSEENGKVIILTGPNMGGKSSYARQVALLVILAQMGSFVPADSLELGLFDNVFTRIGAFDNILRGESTFKVEMSEILRILENCTSRSLVLLDEVGRGTGTEDGKAIASTLLEHFLTETECPLIIFTTHYTMLGLIQSPTLKSYYMDYVEERREGENWPSVVLLYKLRPGMTSNSYGLNVARLAQIDKAIINRAYDLSEDMRKEFEMGRETTFASQMQSILSSNSISPTQTLCRLLEMQKSFDEVTHK